MSFLRTTQVIQPLAFTDIENVEIVFKDGVGYDTNKLLDSVKGRYGEY